MFEVVSGESTAEESKQNIPSFETLASALPEDDREKFASLSEQIEDIKKSHGGIIDDAKLTSSERLLIEEYNELRSRAFAAIRMAK